MSVARLALATVVFFGLFDHDNGGSLACQIGMSACSDSHARAVLTFTLLIFGVLWGFCWLACTDKPKHTLSQEEVAAEGESKARRPDSAG